MLRLMVYDRTCTRHGWFPLGLSHAWAIGGPLYKATDHLDHWTGVSSWSEALDWLGTVGDDAPIAEIQFWGHGRWGRVMVDREVLDRSALHPAHPHHPGLARVRDRMHPGGQWWFRTCETLGARPGHDFAQRWTEFMGCAVAGHTYIIGPLQSGLHRLRAGHAPHWSEWEGVAEGTPDHPRRAFWSRAFAPHTITCLQSRVPEGW